MITVKLIDVQQRVNEIEVEAGTTLMQAAVDNSIDGIVAECGGCCSCATCRCYVDDEWADRLEPATDMEQAMLDFEDGDQANTRLSCQITLTQDLDGLTVYIPESQY
jgi:ferredoxin, 2Fe-2S